MAIENREDMLSLLKTLGLTRLEAQIYLTLLIKGETKAKEIVQAFDIHFPQFYALANSLERKGFIEVQEGRPKKYRAVDPNEIAKRKMKEVEKNMKILTKLVESEHEKAEISKRPSVWITRGVQNVLRNANEIIKSAKYDVTVMIESRFLSRVVGSLIDRKKRGVQTYLVVYPEAPEKHLTDQIEKINRVRVFETCPFAILVIADCERALMAHGLLEIAPPERQYGVVFDEPLTPIFFSERFYEIWGRARPLFLEEDLKFPKTFRSQRMALMEIKNLLKKGEVFVRVKGRRAGKSFEERGVVVGITDNELRKNFTLKLPDAKTLTVGGFYSMLEEVEAELITILKIKPRMKS